MFTALAAHWSIIAILPWGHMNASGSVSVRATVPVRFRLESLDARGLVRWAYLKPYKDYVDATDFGPAHLQRHLRVRRQPVRCWQPVAYNRAEWNHLSRFATLF